MSTEARGTFDVKLNALQMEGVTDEMMLGRRSIDKTFHGDLQGTSKGEMLSAGAVAKGSAAYVAVERVTGTLGGKTGSFSLYHVGLMTRGTPSLTVHVVPDSGTGGLAGISGSLKIEIADGKHSYVFDYTLGATTG